MKQHPWGDFDVEMADLIGRTFTEVKRDHGENEELRFVCADGVFVFSHSQDCCESVEIESIVGDLADLVGEPLLVAEESSSDERPADVPAPEYEPESQTWTFYKFATRQGYVDVRWLGTSNGYYSERVGLEFIPSATGEQT